VKTALIVVLVVVVVLALAAVSQYYSVRNDLVTQRNGMDAAWRMSRLSCSGARTSFPPGGDRERVRQA